MPSYYVENAVDAVHAAYVAGFPAALAQAETDAALAPGSLEQPLEYVKAFLPEDGRFILQIYEDDGPWTPMREAGQRNKVWRVNVVVVLSYSSDANLEAASIKMRRYAKALVQVVVDNATLNGAVRQAAVMGAEPLRQRTKAATRFHYLVGLEVMVGKTP